MSRSQRLYNDDDLGDRNFIKWEGGEGTKFLLAKYFNMKSTILWTLIWQYVYHIWAFHKHKAVLLKYLGLVIFLVLWAREWGVCVVKNARICALICGVPFLTHIPQVQILRQQFELSATFESGCGRRSWRTEMVGGILWLLYAVSCCVIICNSITILSTQCNALLHHVTLWEQWHKCFSHKF